MSVKTFEEINEKIKSGKAVVMTAEEFIAYAEENGLSHAAKEVDVVTTATFGPMCSSGAFLNFGHSDPPIRMAKVRLNDVPAYGGLAAVDAFIGATEMSETRGFEYGGAHVIEDLIAGKPIHLQAYSYGTDCYPRKEISTYLTKDDLNQAYIYNPRNCYQNYAAATNTSPNMLYTYMGILLPECGNVTYSTSGELSPLLKDPEFRTVGLGTHIFLGGSDGYIVWEGTQHVTRHESLKEGEYYAGATLAVIGDLKGMSTEYIRAGVFDKYGITLYVGIGIPIPVIDEEMAAFLAKSNKEIFTKIFDYSVPSRTRPALRTVSYAELRSGSVELNGKKVPTAPLSSLVKARKIASEL
ncbi:MAG TPA: homocysteine biosynthesis protein, partial [Clostridia bacterium]|nr:homocysteine biosynthesis protein [Clostridia bacterium]